MAVDFDAAAAEEQLAEHAVGGLPLEVEPDGHALAAVAGRALRLRRRSAGRRPRARSSSARRGSRRRARPTGLRRAPPAARRAGAAPRRRRTTTTPSPGNVRRGGERRARSSCSVRTKLPVMPWSSAKRERPARASARRSDRALRTSSRSSTQLLGGDGDLAPRELVVLDALDDRPRAAVAADRVAELQALGDAVLTRAADRERVPVVARRGEVDAVAPSRSRRGRRTRPTTHRACR